MNSQAALKKLRELLDDETYQKVMEELAGTTVYFPASGTPTDRNERNLMLKDDFYSGQYEIADLAHKYDLSISRTYKILQSK